MKSALKVNHSETPVGVSWLSCILLIYRWGTIWPNNLWNRILHIHILSNFGVIFSNRQHSQACFLSPTYILHSLYNAWLLNLFSLQFCSCFHVLNKVNIFWEGTKIDEISKQNLTLQYLNNLKWNLEIPSNFVLAFLEYMDFSKKLPSQHAIIRGCYQTDSHCLPDWVSSFVYFED